MKDYYFSKKIGPQGPSLLASWLTTVDLPNNIFIAIGEMMGDYRGYFIKFQNDLLIKGGPYPSPPEHKLCRGCVGKIAVLEAPEGKSRIIAMIDYYSQFVLKAIHDQIFNLLKKFSSDRTFTQSPFGLTLTEGHSYHSFDLSAATDRFPIHVQQKLLGYLYQDSDFAKYWKELLVDRDYLTPDGRNIRYACGTPMGSYTS